jgi:aspartate/methionine/tyrosine aminotransferase
VVAKLGEQLQVPGAYLVGKDTTLVAKTTKRMLGVQKWKDHSDNADRVLYVRSPRGVVGGPRFANAEEFCQYLIREKLICTVPWDNAGPYVRLSVAFQAVTLEEKKRVVAEIGRRLSDVRFEFSRCWEE